jgi:hypothetical protein
MRSHRYLAGGIAAALIFIVSSTVAAKEPQGLAVPIYPNAVPGVLADGVTADPNLVLTFAGGKALDCRATADSGYASGPWCFLTRDPIDKVKAFYEKAAGTLHRVENSNGVVSYQAYVERAWFPGNGEVAPGFDYSGISLHAMPAPLVKGQQPAPSAIDDEMRAEQEAYGFYAGTRFFNVFMDAVNMFGDPSKRPISDLDKLYAQRNKVESAFFQRKGPANQAVDVTIYKHYVDLRGQRQQAAQSETMTAYMQYSAQASQRSVGPTDDEDAQFNAVMEADPALQQRYVALTQQAMTLMMQGKDEEADKIFEEIDEMEAANPELAAMNSQQQARLDKAQAEDKAAEGAIRASGDNALDQAIWGTGLEMLGALEKEAFYTLIVIDDGQPETAKDYSNDRATIEAATKGAIPHTSVGVFGIEYPEGAWPAADASEQAEPEEKESMGSKFKKGFGKLKDLAGN